MKNTTFIFTLLLISFLNWSNKITPAKIPNFNKSEFNRLNWVETYQSRFSTQIMFDFAHPIYFKKKILKENFQLQLIFPGMQLRQFCVKQITTKLNALKQYGLIKNIRIFEKNKNIPKVILAIEFAKTKQIKNKDKHNIHETKSNRLLIKWYKMEDPNRLIIDIFTQEDLDKLKDKNETILFAHNSNKDLKQSKMNRVVIDPGHGGLDNGAQCFNFTEKDISLKIAKKTRSLLQQQGYDVLLTRNQDQDLSLLERSILAEQLRADIFVSIHVNSVKKIPNPTGIETFYLENSELVAPTRQGGGFLFINLKKDLSLIQLIDKEIENNTQTSKALANSIQTNLITYLKNQNILIIDRGIKANKFRILLRSPIPTTLVEVGFITNKNDAFHLTNESYQQHIATGISKGINSFIQQL